MKLKYKIIDTSTLQGLKMAERYKNSGWKIIKTGLYLVYFQKMVAK